jgi:hypothetical protein
MLPEWPAGTVSILVTTDPEPHAIPVSAAVRAGANRILLGLATRRGSLARLRRAPAVAVTVLAAEVAFTARGHGRVLREPLLEGMAAVEVLVHAVDDHRQPTFSLDAGVAWHWDDADAEQRDGEVRAALKRLVPIDAEEPGRA